MTGTEALRQGEAPGLPDWLPDTVRHYLDHTEGGVSIRQVARGLGVHASTVLRQIRRTETRRDDPLVDAALRALGRARTSGEAPDGIPACQGELERGAARVLRRMCETGAVLAVAEGMDKAVVVRDGADSVAARTAVVETELARAMALMDWIACSEPGRVCRYRITAAGRMALGRIMAQGENRARARQDHGFAEAQAAFGGAEAGRKSRYGLVESPLAALARRKDGTGRPFLDEALVSAGERLREDFELSQMGPRTAMNWDRFLTGGGRGGFTGDPAPGGAGAARGRVERALADLGPGLSDVALRCCCFLEGLESAEKKMGWSARSGKIVLRIALQRLRQHYEGLTERDQMIG